MSSSAVVPPPTRLINRDFGLFWQGQLVSHLGSQMFLVALLLWLRDTTDSATLIGLVLTTAMLPGVLLGPFGGALADRRSRRGLLVACDALRALLFGLLAVGLWLLPERRTELLAGLYACAFLSGALGAVFQPAGQAWIPDLVPPQQVGAANSLLQGSFQIFTFVGQALGGVLFRLVGAPALAVIDALSFAYAALSTALVRRSSDSARLAASDAAPEARGWRATWAQLRRDTAEGLRHIGSRPGLSMLFAIMALLRFFTVPFSLLLPFYVENRLQVPSDWYGFLLAAIGLGALVGFVLAGALPIEAEGRARAMISALAAVGLGLAGLGLVTSPALALLLLFMVGLADGFINVGLVTVLQIATAPELRGRVFGVLRTVSDALAPASLAVTGIVADLVHREVAGLFVVCGLVVVGGAIVTALNRACRQVLSGANEPGTPQPASPAAPLPIKEVA